MVVPSHAVNGRVLAGLDVERDDEADLLLVRVADRRGPRILLPEHVVDRLLVREQDVPVEPFSRGREVVRAEALVAQAARDGKRAVEDTGGVLIEDQVAHLCIVEVVLPVGRRRRGRVVQERHLARLVVHEQVDPSLAARLDRDPVRDRLEAEAAREPVADREAKPTSTPGITAVSIEGPRRS